MFDYAAASIGDKIKYVNVDSHGKAADVRNAIDLLARSGIIHRVYHSDGTGTPLGATIDETAFRLLFLDIGLMNAVNGTPPFGLETFKNARFVNEGRLAEQVVGQHLLHAHPPYIRPSLHYWLREGKKGNAQIDYLLQCDNQVVPVEVKAGTSGSLKSLHQFVAARSSPLAVRFDLNPPSITAVEHAVAMPDGKVQSARFRLLSLPLYMVEETMRIVTKH